MSYFQKPVFRPEIEENDQVLRFFSHYQNFQTITGISLKIGTSGILNAKIDIQKWSHKRISNLLGDIYL